ncbi:hypothetical protein [Cupriavidus plantarum]|nr:hypothetical protein [Cupriavidus plantarum]RLK45940.1 hypothetical protein C7417_1970 [Cupriavidus plantarum]
MRAIVVAFYKWWTGLSEDKLAEYWTLFHFATRSKLRAYWLLLGLK